MSDEKPSKPEQKPMDAGRTPERSKANLDREVQAKIGQQLRSMFNDVVNEGVPPRFTELLNRLDKSNDAESK